MIDLLPSLRFCSAYIHGEQVGTGDMAYHVVEHIRFLEEHGPQDEERRAACQTIAFVARDFAKVRGNPWL